MLLRVVIDMLLIDLFEVHCTHLDSAVTSLSLHILMHFIKFGNSAAGACLAPPSPPLKLKKTKTSSHG